MLWEPVYGGRVLHSWVWQGRRTWTTVCGLTKPMGRKKLLAKKCAKCERGRETEPESVRVFASVTSEDFLADKLSPCIEPYDNPGVMFNATRICLPARLIRERDYQRLLRRARRAK